MFFYINMSIFIMKGGELIDEGGYGCVFHPAINEKGEDMKTLQLVSKLQKYNTIAINEIEIKNCIMVKEIVLVYLEVLII